MAMPPRADSVFVIRSCNPGAAGPWRASPISSSRGDVCAKTADEASRNQANFFITGLSIHLTPRNWRLLLLEHLELQPAEPLCLAAMWGRLVNLRRIGNPPAGLDTPLRVRPQTRG